MVGAAVDRGHLGRGVGAGVRSCCRCVKNSQSLNATCTECRPPLMDGATPLLACCDASVARIISRASGATAQSGGTTSRRLAHSTQLRGEGRCPRVRPEGRMTLVVPADGYEYRCRNPSTQPQPSGYGPFDANSVPEALGPMLGGRRPGEITGRSPGTRPLAPIHVLNF